MLNNTTYQSVTADQIQSAHFFLTEASGSAYELVYLHPQNTTSNWDESTATWSKVGYYDNDWYREASMGYCETESFDITELVQRWKEGRYDSGWCGFILVSEWQSTMKKTLYTSEHSTTERRPYVVVEYAEAITPEPEPEPDPTISLNVTSTSVLVGNSVILTATTNSDAPTWTSSNTEIATVNSAGEVTGVHAGVTTITATVSGVSASCVVYVVLTDGQYLIHSGSYHLSPDVISYAEDTLVETKYRALSGPIELSQIWDVRYQENGCYTISTIYKSDLRLFGFGGALAVLSSGTSGNVHRWKIQYNGSGYVLTNEKHNTSVLAPTTASGTASNEGSVGLVSSTSSNFGWQLTATTAEGMMLLDSTTGIRKDSGSSNSEVYMEPNSSKTLGGLGVDLKIFDGTTTSQAYTMSFNPSIVTFSLTSNTITSTEYGHTTATISRAIGGELYTISFLLYVHEPISVVNYYDSSFSATHRSYIGDAINFANKAYLFDGYSSDFKDVFYYAYMDTGTRQNYSSIDSLYDECPQTGSCVLGTQGCGSVCDTHHKSLRRIAEVLQPQYNDDDENRVQVLWTNRPSHYFCNDSEDLPSTQEHETRSEYAMVLRDNYSGIMRPKQVVHFMRNPETSSDGAKAFMSVTLAHEIAHTLGLADVYNDSYGDNPNHDISEGWRCVMELYETYKLTDFYEDIYYGREPAFCDYCINKLVEELKPETD